MAKQRKAPITKANVREVIENMEAKGVGPSYKARQAAERKQNADYEKGVKAVRDLSKSSQKDLDTRAASASKRGMIDAGFLLPNGEKKSKAQVEREAAAKKDKRLAKLPEDAQTNLNTVRNADKESKELGEERKEKKSTFVKVLDFISRTYRATAAAAGDNQEAFYRAKFKGDGNIKALAKGVEAGFDGYLTDIKEGKVRGGFKNKVIESSRGNRQALAQGIDPALVGRVKAKTKAGRIADSILGGTLDIFADPLTYVGIGTVSRAVGVGGKVLKSDEIAKMLEETVSQSKKLNANRSVKEDTLAVARLLGAERTPVKALKKKDYKNLSDEAKAVYDFAKSMQKGRQGLRRSGSETTFLNRKSDLSSSKGRAVKEAVQVEARETVKAFKIAEFNKVIQKYSAKGVPITPQVRSLATAKANTVARKQGIVADDIAESLLLTMNRNLAPTIKKNVKIGVGPASIVLPTLGVAKAARKVGEIPQIAKSVENFHKALNANYKVVAGVGRIRNQVAGIGTSEIKAHVEELQSVFNPLKKPERIALMKAWRSGARTGSYKGGISLLDGGASVDDALKYFDTEVRNIQASLDDLYKNANIDYEDLNKFLGDKFRISDKDVYNKGLMRQDWFIDMMTRSAGKIDDPAEAILLFKSALTNAVTKRTLWDQFRENFGVIAKPAIVGNGPGASSAAMQKKTAEVLMRNNGYVRALDGNGKPIRGLEDAVFHPEIAESMKRLDAVFKDPKTTGQFINTYDKALMTWKGLVTRYNPSFHTRTLLGEVLLGYLGGMRNIPGSYAKAAKVLKGRNQEFLNPGFAGGNVSAKGSGLTGRQVNARNVLANAGANSRLAITGSSAVVIRHKRFKQDITADQLWHLYQQSGLKSGFASADLVRGVAPLKSTTLGKVDTAVSNFTEGVEDFGRMAHFIDAITYSKARNLDDAVEEAAEIVSKMHLDYTAVTGFEKSTMTRVMPFYKWLRLSSPLMVEHLLHNPGKAMIVPKAMQTVSDATGYDVEEFGAFPGGPDAVVPEFLRGHGAMPIGNFFGNTNYYDPAALFPLAGTLEATSPSKLVGAATPAFKIPAEIALNQSFFGGKPQDDIKKYMLSQLPQTNFANNMATGGTDPGIPRTQRLLQFLANPGIQPNTEKRQRGETFRQREEALKHRDALREKLGIKP